MQNGLPPRPTGSGPDATFMQWLWDRFAMERPVIHAGQPVSKTTRGTIIHPGARGRGGTGADTPPLVLAQIGAVRGDYYLAYLQQSAGFAEVPTYIAKPPRLRKSRAHDVVEGITIDYTYPFGTYNPVSGMRLAALHDGPGGAVETTETQVVIPRWRPGLPNVATADLIVAIKMVPPVNPTVLALEDDGSLIQYLDLNIEARAWARVWNT